MCQCGPVADRERGIQHPDQHYYYGQKWLDSETELKGIHLHSQPVGACFGKSFLDPC